MEEKSLPPLSWVGGIVQKLKLGSVLDSLIAPSIIFTALLVFSVLYGPEWLTIGAFVVVVLVIVVILGCFTYFSVKDPDKLRPSEHEIRKMEISAGLGNSEKLISEEKLEQLPAKSADEPPADAEMILEQMESVRSIENE